MIIKILATSALIFSGCCVADHRMFDERLADQEIAVHDLARQLDSIKTLFEKIRNGPYKF